MIRIFVDARDGRTYKCVLMPDGKWWSENLAWEGNGYAHTDPASYGRLYTLTEALAACPAGCHIPTLNEYQAFGIPQTAKLKENSPLWLVEPGTDDYGFAVRPAGYEYNGTIGNVGGAAYLITNTVNGSNYSLVNVVTGDWATGQGYDPVRFSARFIVDQFPIPEVARQITSAGNFQLQTANRQFKSEAGSYHTLGSQGLPILRCNLNWDLATATEETSFRNWFDPETSWDHDDFPGIGDVTLQAAGLPKYTRTVKGLSISLDVAIFPRALATLYTYTGAVPVMTPYAGVEAGYTYAPEQAVVTTSGRVALRQVAGERGESFEISWQTSLVGLMGFIAWFAYIKNGRRQFLGSMCGKTAWLWKIIGVPSYSLTGPDYARITMTVNGRDVRRALTVTIEKET